MNPFRGAALEQLERFAERYARRRVEHQVHVIFDPTDRKRYEAMLACNPAQIGPNTGLNIRRYPTLTILGAKNDVIMEAGIGVRHRSPRRSEGNVRFFPVMVNRRAATVGKRKI